MGRTQTQPIDNLRLTKSRTNKSFRKVKVKCEDIFTRVKNELKDNPSIIHISTNEEKSPNGK